MTATFSKAVVCGVDYGNDEKVYPSQNMVPFFVKKNYMPVEKFGKIDMLASL